MVAGVEADALGWGRYQRGMRLLERGSIISVTPSRRASHVVKAQIFENIRKTYTCGSMARSSISGRAALTASTPVSRQFLSLSTPFGVDGLHQRHQILSTNAASSGVACPSPEPLAGTSQPGNLLVTIQLAAVSCVSWLVNKLNNVILKARRTMYFNPSEDEAKALKSNARKSWKQMRTLAVVAPFASASSSGGATTMILLTAAVASFIKLYLLLLFLRVLLGWFTAFNWDRQPWLALRQMTDPYLNLFRGLVPPLLGTIDFTPLLGFLILQFLQGALENAASSGDPEADYW